MKAGDLLTILDAIDPALLLYQDWINVGMILKDNGYTVDVWDDWSRRDPRYRSGECARKWEGFGRRAGGVGSGTLVHLAKEQGWTAEPKSGGLMGWDDIFHYNKPAEAPVFHVRPADDFDPREQVKSYLSTLFKPDDYIGVCASSQQMTDTRDQGGRLSPGTRIRKSVADVLRAINEGRELDSIFGTPVREAGAWIGFNPIKPEGRGGVSDADVADWRYALVECDNMPIDDQYKLYHDMKLPIKVLVHSGGKSLHAIVKINAQSEQEYRDAVNWLYDQCRARGMTLDPQNRNPSRLSRLPGYERGQNRQYIVEYESGCSGFREWKSWIEDAADDTPGIVSLADMWGRIPPLKPELIHGVLRRGHKMLISGASKAGKSYLLIELAACIAEGLPWLGFQCEQGNVLYINLELDEDSCWNRIGDIYTARGINPRHLDALDVWNLRGRGCPLDELYEKLMRRSAGRRYDLIIFDPIYKIETGDENNAADMGRFCNLFDKVARDKDTAVAYCHHHSKGGQSHKNAIDRMSGSGVFARDPDAVLDLIELQVPDELRLAIANDERAEATAGLLYSMGYEFSVSCVSNWGDMDALIRMLVNEDDRNAARRVANDVFASVKRRTAYRLECTLREFPRPDPVGMWFDWPLHTQDTRLSDLDPADSAEGGRQKGLDTMNAVKRDRHEERKEAFLAAIDNAACGDPPTLAEVANYMKVSKGSISGTGKIADECGYKLDWVARNGQQIQAYVLA